MIGIKARGLEEVKTTLEGLQGSRVVGIVTEAAAAEVVQIMREQPADTPYQYISRASAYGTVSNENPPAPDGYFSWKQFRFVMASIRRGTIGIPYRRTGNVSNAWHVEGKLSKAKAVNDNTAAPFVFGDSTQSRHENAVGWQKVGVRLDQNSNRIFDAAYDALAAYIRRKKK